MAKNYKEIINKFQNASKRIQEYFPDFITLVNSYKWEVSVSYIFSRIEYVKHLTIYCGIVKLHKCEAKLTWKMVNNEYMSRTRFKELFEIVFDKKIQETIMNKLEKGERIRDKIMHGKDLNDAEIRDGLVNTIDFIIEFNDYIFELARFRPFGSQRGFNAGAINKLDKSTTSWVLKGMGIPKKNI